ncbi:MAG: metabolite traffic protein EboE [Geobacter sp.]|nr:metabolite traffic protein EboE [Geobacter sp.]
MSQIPDRLITYCTNIHPGETWEETFAALKAHVPAIKATCSPRRPFPVGLRLSNRAAADLTTNGLSAFADWLAEEDCFVPTINGFPFGAFHGARIKEGVYLPDWRSPERVAYTIRLADLLAALLPAGSAGSISTVPLAFKKGIATSDLPTIRKQLKSVLTHLSVIADRQGKDILLALEPEPGCLLETTDEVCRFFESIAFSPRLRRHLAICYDCCHQAVGFEEPSESLRRLAQAEVPLAKVQVSSALKLNGADAALLKGFDDPCYLHQVVVKGDDGRLSRYADIGEALAGHAARREGEWRCHFHLPIHLAGSGPFGTTQGFLADFLPLIGRDLLLEVETYTWSVLPDFLREESVTDSIIREISWLEAQLHA